MVVPPAESGSRGLLGVLPPLRVGHEQESEETSARDE